MAQKIGAGLSGVGQGGEGLFAVYDAVDKNVHSGDFEQIWADASGNGRTATRTTQPATTAGFNGTAIPQFTREGLLFSDVSDCCFTTVHADCDFSLGSSGVTVLATIKTTDSTGGSPGGAYDGDPAVCIMGDSTSAVGCGFGIHGGKVRATFYQGGWHMYDSVTSVDDGKWHQIAFTRVGGNPSRIEIYIDGELDYENNSAYNSNRWMYDSIGRGYNIADRYTGHLRNVVVWNKTLTPQEIKATWNAQGGFDAVVGNIVAVNISNVGSGYTGNGILTAVGGGGTGFTGTYTQSGGTLSSVSVTTEGSGYTSEPTIIITPTSGTSGATGQVLPQVNFSRGTYERVGNMGTGSDPYKTAGARFFMGFKYRQIINYAYTMGGYKSNVPWKSVHKTITSTDQTSNLGDQLGTAANYTSGGCNLRLLFMWGASNSHPGESTNTTCMNMFTDTVYTPTSAMHMIQTRNDCGCVFKEHDFAWIGGGGSSNVDKFNYHTETMATSTISGGINNNADQKACSAFSDQHYGYWWVNAATSSQKVTFATDSFAASSQWASNGQQKGISSKVRKGYAGNEGSYNGGYNLRRWNLVTDTNYGTMTKPQPNCGEENFTMGQDHQYMLGNYDGAQNNENWKILYANDAGYANIAGLSPTAHAGQSSGHCAWRE